MKTFNSLWDGFTSWENFDEAEINARRDKGKQSQVREFQENRDAKLEKVRQSVINGTFYTSRYRKKKVYEPKERDIYILPYEPDRIVQHAVMNILRPILTKKFMQNSFACVEGKGPHRASQKCAEFTRKYKYCLKCDIHHFYPSVNQKILSDMLHRIIKDERFMRVVDDIVFSFEGETNVPIGNYCSQWFGNFYLTKLDNYILHELKCGALVRYCDDFLLFSDSKEELQRDKALIKEFIWENLRLEFSKADVFSTRQGVDFCGYRCFKDYVLLRKSTAKRIRRRITKIETLDTHTQGQLASAKGQLKHCCSYNFRKSIGLERRMYGQTQQRNNGQ